jgi:hypothetical protein
LEAQIYELTRLQLLAAHNLSQIEREKAIYDQLLLTGNFQSLTHYVIWLDRIPDLLTSMFVQPWSDFAGNILQRLPNIEGPSQSCAVSILANDCGGAVVFSWDAQQSPAMIQFVSSLHRIPDDQLTDALIRFAFEYSDNICLAPTWWQRLNSNSKQVLIRRFASDVSHDRHKDCLLDDGLTAGDWKPSRRISNMQL